MVDACGGRSGCRLPPLQSGADRAGGLRPHPAVQEAQGWLLHWQSGLGHWSIFGKYVHLLHCSQFAARLTNLLSLFLVSAI